MTAILQLLLKKGGDMNKRSEHGTPLAFALAAGEEETAEYLKARGAVE
jgi:hypothetical protein